jgi:sterol desaturase/sphingolipid hydroxylase (fatty acid hydroxylase superfamily)
MARGLRLRKTLRRIADALAQAGSAALQARTTALCYTAKRSTRVLIMIDRTTFTIVVLLVLATLFVAERFLPLRLSTRPFLGRLLVNLAISALSFAGAMLLARPAALSVLDWASDRPFGLVHVLPMPVVVQFVVAFLLMDLTFYWWHVANHRMPFLWRFHNVHHIDPDLDLSTAFRFHVGEIALSTAFRIVQVGVIGLSVWMFAAYEIVFQVNTLFHHSNVRLPIGIERLLNLVIVTPRMHGIHHSQVRDETESNFSVVFSWWDRLHRTIGLNIPQAEIVIGVPGYAQEGDNSLVNALVLPFRRQRDYWRRPDGTIVRRTAALSSGERSRLAE